MDTAPGLVDRGDRGRLAVSGPDAAAALDGVVTNEVLTLEPGTGVLAAVLTPKGKMLGDLRVVRSGDELVLGMERAALQGVFDAIRHGLVGYRAELHKRTLECGELSLLGPGARAAAGVPDLPAAEHANAPATIGGVPVLAIATDLGLDVLCSADATGTVRDALLAAGAAPMDATDAEVLRVERGRPRYGVDLDDSVIPQEAGLNERAVSFTKGCYVGQETVARLFYKGKPNRHLRGLRLSAPTPAGAPLTLGTRAVGTLTSSVVSPAFGPIGLALVRREAEPGATVQVEGAGSAIVTEASEQQE